MRYTFVYIRYIQGNTQLLLIISHILHFIVLSLVESLFLTICYNVWYDLVCNIYIRVRNISLERVSEMFRFLKSLYK